MFAYCLNNPIDYADRSGTDAVWIQEENSVFTMGHSGLLVQDGNGQWYYFFWGNGTNDKNYTFYLIPVDVEGYNLNNSADVNEVVDNALDLVDDGSKEFDEFRERRLSVTSTTYFAGNYTKTYNDLIQLGEDAASGKVKYDAIFKNCGQVSWSAMSKSDERFTWTSCSTVPNVSYSRIRRFAIFEPDQHRDYIICQLLGAS